MIKCTANITIYDFISQSRYIDINMSNKEKEILINFKNSL